MALRVSLFLDDKGTKRLKKFGGTVAGITGQFVKFGIVGSAAFAGVSAKLAGDLNKQLREISTLMTDVTENDIKVMGKELESLSGISGLAMKSLTKARYDIVSSGFSDAAKSAMVLGEAVKLAVGGESTAANAADILTTALNAYRKTAADASDVADILFTTVRLGKTTMDELSQSMGNMLPIAKSAKVRLSDSAAALALVTANGIDTATASTSLKNAFKSLAAPTSDAAQAMKDAGIEVKYMDDGSMDLVSTLRQFSGLTLDKLKDFIPDIRAINAIQVMADNIDLLSNNVDAMANRAGASSLAFDKMSKEWNTKLLRLKNNFLRIMRAFGNVVIDVLTPAVDAGNEILGRLGDVGWDNVFAIIRDNWETFGIQLQEIFKLILEPLPAIAGKVFTVIGKVAIAAFKIGWQGAGITLKSLLFPSDSVENMGKLVSAVGSEAAKKFAESGEWADLGEETAKIFASKNKEAILARADELGLKEAVKRALGEGTWGEDAAREMWDKLSVGLDGEKLAVAFGNDFKNTMRNLDFQSIISEGLADTFGISPERIAEIKRRIEQIVSEIEKGNQDLIDSSKKADEDILKSKLLTFDYILSGNIELTNEQKELLRQLKEGEAEYSVDSLEGWAMYNQSKAENFQQITDTLTRAIVGFYDADLTNIRKALEKQTSEVEVSAGDRLKIVQDMLDSGTISEADAANRIETINAQKQQRLADLNKRALEDERIIKQKQKQWAIAQVAIDTGVAIMKIWAGVGGPVFKTMMTAATIALGASQTAQIQAQSFAHGTGTLAITPSPSTPASDTVPAMLTPGEMVMTRDAAEQYGDQIARMNQSAAGGGSGSSNSNTIIIQAIDSKTIIQFADENPDAMARIFKNLIQTNAVKLYVESTPGIVKAG